MNDMTDMQALKPVIEAFRRVRAETEARAAPLSAEDQLVQEFDQKVNHIHLSGLSFASRVGL